MAPSAPDLDADTFREIHIDDERWGSISVHAVDPAHLPDIEPALTAASGLVADALRRTHSFAASDPTTRDSASLARGLRQFVEIATTPMFVKDLEGRYTMHNQAFSKLMGPVPGGIHGKTDAEIHDGLYAAEFVRNDRIVIERGEVIQFDETAVAEDGRLRSFIATKFPIRALDGSIAGVGGISTEITDRREDERAMLALQEQLRRSEKMSVVGEMTSSVTHDLNNYLTAILGIADRIARLSTDPASAADATLIAETAAKAAAVTRQVVGFGRQPPTERGTVDLHELLTTLIQLLERGDPAHEFRARFDATHAGINAEEPAILSALLNVLTNARDAMPDGGTISVSTRLVGAGTIEIGIADTGSGMTESEITRAFDQFFTTKPDGTGLGLPSVKRTIEQHGGSIRIESKPGGTTVRIELPLPPDTGAPNA